MSTWKVLRGTLLIAIIIPALSGCASPRPSGSLLRPNEFALTVMFGTTLICEKAIRRSCGISLSVCKGQPGVSYECSTDVVIVDASKGLR